MPWRALEDPGSPEQHDSRPRFDRSGPARGWLIAGAIAVGLAIVVVVVLTGSNGTSIVSASTAGGDSPNFSPGDTNGSLVAGGDGAGPAGQKPDGSAGVGVGAGAGAGDGNTGASGGSEQLVVEVAGAVAQPGVYRLPAGTRVADAIRAAGGYGPRIDVARATAELNLAARLSDGDRILVPSRDDLVASSGPGNSPATKSPPVHSGPVDLNRATAEELDALPGVGPVTVARIIASRSQHAFRAISDLRTRKLVGAAEFARIQKLVTVH